MWQVEMRVNLLCYFYMVFPSSGIHGDIRLENLRKITGTNHLQILRELCNNQRPRCDIRWVHATNHLYHGFPSLITMEFHFFLKSCDLIGW
jgi:hypothetical protein